MRDKGRKYNQLREISIKKNILNHAEGSCEIRFGNTHVICSASIDESVPRFLRNKGKGWVTAEYGMLPRSTHARMKREASNGKQSGRTLEIQRLIGRSMRAAIDLTKLGERQIIIDCDVINADGGTRTAAITGSYVAICLAIRTLIDRKILKNNPVIRQVAAVSCGILEGKAIIDLDYIEDSSARVDANFVFTQDGNLIEVQASGEESHFSKEELQEMLQLISDRSAQIFAAQNAILMDFKI